MNRTSSHPTPPPHRRRIRVAGTILLACTVALAGAGAAEAKKCTKKGTGAADVLKGTKKKDVLCGKGGDDLLLGKGGNDVLRGGAGADAVTGKSGNDTLAGGPGDDTLAGGKGDDKLKGQAGVDMAGFAAAPSPVSADLGAGTASGDGNDTLIAVENVTGSAFDDDLTGDAGPNQLSGGEGNDRIVGAGGDDALEGQGGVDSTTYASLSNAVQADLRAGTVAGDGNDTVSGIENLTGSATDDTIIGDDADNVLDGGPGRDTISFAGAPGGVDADLGASASTGDGTDALAGFEDLAGSANADQLRGDGANNQISGGGGNDTLVGADGNDGLDGGAGADTASYGGSSSRIDANLRGGVISGQGHDLLAGVENVTGSPFGDLLAGDAAANVLVGGDGADTVTFAASPQGIASDLGSGTTTGDGADTLLGIENAIGSGHPDSIVGTVAGNALAGGAGEDVLSGADGADHLIGEDGADSLFGGDDDDDISGGDGDDHLDGGLGSNECDGGEGANTFAGNCDGGPPVLTDLEIDPASVDTSGAAQTVDFTLAITDDAAGLDPAGSSVTVRGPGGAPIYVDALDPVSGTPVDGTYSASITLPRFSAQGRWAVTVDLTDQSANHDTVTTAELATAGLPNDFQQTGADDSEGPSLTDFVTSPSSIDTSTGPAVIAFDLSATDDLAGIDLATSLVRVRNPNGQVYEVPLALVSGTPLDGTYHASLTIPRYAPQGTWTVELVLVDGAGNTTTVTSADLSSDGTFQQTGPGDSTTSSLTAFTRSPGQINTSAAARTVSVTLHAVDTLSGIDPDASRITFIDPVDQFGGDAPLTLTSGTVQDGNFAASITIPQGSATGTWKIRVELADAAGNVETLTSGDLIAAGFQGTFENLAPSGT